MIFPIPPWRSLARSAPVKRLMSTMVGVESKVVLKGGQPIKYVEAGDGHKVALLLPGVLGTARSDFSYQLEYFEGHKDLKIVAWDPPGYGESRPPERTWPAVPNYYHRDADSAAEFMAELGHEKYALVGWSDGAITSLIIAAKYHRNVSRLVAYAGQSYYSEKDKEMLDKVSDVSGWSDRMKKPMEDIYGKEQFPILWAGFNAAIKNMCKDHKNNICNELLKDISCPTLIIQGDKDAMVSEEHPLHLHHNIRGSKMEIFPDGKHNLHLKYKDKFNKMVEEFLL